MGRSPRSEPPSHDAAVYVRMSTEHQQYSTLNQMDVIRDFAQQRGLNIIETYSDEGKSGLQIRGREALGRLIQAVDSGEAKFRHILVYDVSRWGRFQDADESAYYEYVCRRAGIAVHYCAEQFDNDGSPACTIIKSVKRAMAGEYSRELSTKVFQGACRLVQLGFRQGGVPGYGLRRMLVGEHGQRKCILQPGEHKYIHTDHVILVPGPDSEVKTVRWIFRQFVNRGRSEREIAAALNKRRILNGDRPWNQGIIHDLLINEKYIGHNVYHRTSYKLQKKHVTNPPDMWIRGDNVFEGIIPKSVFEEARHILLTRNQKITERQIVAYLRRILKRSGKITRRLIDESDERPFMPAIRRRFGTLAEAYSHIGYRPNKDYRYKAIIRKLRGTCAEVMDRVCQQMAAMGGVARKARGPRFLIINEMLAVKFNVCRHYYTGARASHWVIEAQRPAGFDFMLVARMQPQDDSIRDYYLIPADEIKQRRTWLMQENGSDWDGYRFSSLENLCSLFEQVTLETPS